MCTDICRSTWWHNLFVIFHITEAARWGPVPAAAAVAAAAQIAAAVEAAAQIVAPVEAASQIVAPVQAAAQIVAPCQVPGPVPDPERDMGNRGKKS